MRVLHRSVLAVGLVVVAAGASVVALRRPADADDRPATTATADPALVARGAYVAKLGDCAACHTVPGEPAFSGGLPLHSPIGTMFSTNITPDPDTGIGRYTLEDFRRALREGRSPRHRLYPAMPYPSFAKVSDADIAALYAFFMHGVAPVRRVPPQTDLPFPFDQRWGLAVWDVVFKPSDPYRPDPSHDATWNRGAYLVQGLGHCGSCHTPRGPAYEERGYDEHASHYLAGGVNDEWTAPNLTGDGVVGLGRWSKDDLVRFLKTGHGARTMAFGPMEQVVDDSTQYMTGADLDAIADYLKSLPSSTPRHRDLTTDTTQALTVSWATTGDVRRPGDGLYMNFCAKCHGRDGRGDPAKAPALAGSALVRSIDPSSVIHIVLVGGRPHVAPGVPRVEPMPHFDDEFDDREIADVASYVRRSWGNDAPPVDTRMVRRLRETVVKEDREDIRKIGVVPPS